MSTKIATIQKVRYLTRPNFHVEVQYTVEGSDKVYKHTMSKSHKLSDWRREEIHQLSKYFWDKMKPMGDGCKSKILYDGYKSKNVLQFEIQMDFGHFNLKAISSSRLLCSPPTAAR